MCGPFVSISWDLTLPGKHYYEVSCHDQGLCRVGWSTMQASLDLGECFCSNWTALYLFIVNIVLFGRQINIDFTVLGFNFMDTKKYLSVPYLVPEKTWRKLLLPVSTPTPCSDNVESGRIRFRVNEDQTELSVLETYTTAKTLELLWVGSWLEPRVRRPLVS